MKHLYTLLYIIALLALAACEDGNDFGDDRKPGPQPKTVPHSLEVSPSSTTLSADAQTTTINIQDNGKWTATSSQQWCTLSATSGKGNASLTVNVTGNTSISIRQATITVTAGDKKKEVTMTQLGVEQHTSAPSTSLGFTTAANSMEIAVTSNEEWTATSSDETWCAVSPASASNSGTVYVTVTENTTTSQRTATVTITGKTSGDKTEITVTQQGVAPHTSAPSTPLNFTTASATREITVTSNEEWTATSSDTSWCNVSPASGTNNGTVTVTVAENTTISQRTATVTITGKMSGDKTEITVTQQGVAPHTSAPSTPLNFTTASATREITVTSNEEWTAKSSEESWCTVSPASGTNNGTVTVTVAENTTTSQRSAIVTITGKTSGDKTEITVTQEGSDIPPSEDDNVLPK